MKDFLNSKIDKKSLEDKIKIDIKKDKIKKYLYESYVLPRIETPRRLKPDFTLIANLEGEEIDRIKVNSFVLDSDYFMNFFFSGYKYDENIVIEVNSYKTLNLFVEFLYMGDIERERLLGLEIEILVDLILISDRFFFTELKQKFINVMKLVYGFK